MKKLRAIRSVVGDSDALTALRANDLLKHGRHP